MKRSPNERHKCTHGGLTDMFWQSQRSISIRRESVREHLATISAYLRYDIMYNTFENSVACSSQGLHTGQPHSETD